MTYAAARTFDPQTGDWLTTNDPVTSVAVFDLAASPALELVKRILRTPRGACLLDPTLGVDWTKVDPLGTNAEATGEL